MYLYIQTICCSFQQLMGSNEKLCTSRNRYCTHYRGKCILHDARTKYVNTVNKELVVFWSVVVMRNVNTEVRRSVFNARVIFE
jgi:hypothetical protein